MGLLKARVAAQSEAIREDSAKLQKALKKHHKKKIVLTMAAPVIAHQLPKMVAGMVTGALVLGREKIRAGGGGLTQSRSKPPTREVAVQPSAQPTAPVAVAIPTPSISVTPSPAEALRLRFTQNSLSPFPIAF
jgi:hypothetical protein